MAEVECSNAGRLVIPPIRAAGRDHVDNLLGKRRLAGMQVPDLRVVISVAGGQGESSEADACIYKGALTLSRRKRS
jgi:hypothetical protein